MEGSIKKHWARRCFINLDDEDTDGLNEHIYWEGLKKFSSMIPSHRRIWITKHMAHAGATGINMGPKRRKERDMDKCPMCPKAEDSLHVYMCTSELTEKEFIKKEELTT